MQTETIFKKEDIVSIYTSKEAVSDGLLFDLDLINKNPKYFVKYITTNLMSKGYFLEVPPNETAEMPNIPNLKDLVNQAAEIFQNKLAEDTFASGNIELPSGEQQQIFLAVNETGRYTLMLPEDY
jgi:hypothetical protein